MTSNSNPLHQAECPRKSYCNSYFPYEDGTDRVLWNVGTQNSVASESPKRKNTI